MSSVKKSSRKLLAVLLSVLMAFSSAPGVMLLTAFAAEKVDVTVLVCDSASAGIEGAEVTLGEESGTTGPDGKVLLSVEEGNYDLVATMDGYQSVSTPASVTSSTTDLTVSMLKTKTITGSVSANIGEPTINATVTPNGSATVTDFNYSNGSYTFTGLEGETYVVSATAKNYADASKTVDIDSVDNNLEVQLKKQTVTVTYDSTQGTYTIDKGTEIAGDIEVDIDDSPASIKVTANTGYHINSITGIDSNYTNSGTTNDAKNAVNDLEEAITVDSANRAITIQFAINKYDVTVDTNATSSKYKEATATVDKTEVEHGSTVDLTVDTKGKFNVSNIAVGANNLAFTTDADDVSTLTYTVNETTKFDVTYTDMQAITATDAGITFANYDNVKGNTYYANNDVVISTTSQKIKYGTVTPSQSLTVSATTNINPLCVRKNNKWYFVADSSDNAIAYKVVIDKENPTISCESTSWVDGTNKIWTNVDGSVVFDINDTGDSKLIDDMVVYSESDSLTYDAENDCFKLPVEDTTSQITVVSKNTEDKYEIDFTDPQEKTYYIYAVDNSTNVTKDTFDVRIDKSTPTVTDITYTVDAGQSIEDKTIEGKPAKVASDTVTISVTAKDAEPSSGVKAFKVQLSDYNSVLVDGIINDTDKQDGTETGYKTATAKLIIDKTFISSKDYQDIKVVAIDNAGNESNPTDDATANANYDNYLLAISTEKPSATITHPTKDSVYTEGTDEKWYDEDFDIVVDVADFDAAADEKFGTSIKSVDLKVNNTSYTVDTNGDLVAGTYSYAADTHKHTDKYKFNTSDEAFVEGKNTVSVDVKAYNDETFSTSFEFYLDRNDPYVTTVEVAPKENEGWLKRLLFGNFSKNDLTVTVTTKDELATSGLKEITLYNGTEVLETQTVETAATADSVNVFVIKAPTANGTSVAFVGNITAKVTDKVGHTNGTYGVNIVNNTINDINIPNKKVASNVDSNYFNLEISAPTIDTNITATTGVNEKTFDSTKIWYGADQEIEVTYKDQVNGDENEAGLNNIKATVNGVVAYDEDLTENNTKTDSVPSKIKTINTADFAAGNNNEFTFELYAQDNAGNDYAVTPVIYVDKTAPAVTKFDFVLKDYQDGKNDGIKETATEGDQVKNEDVITTPYGYYFNKATKVTITASDVPADGKPSSGVKTISYMLIDQYGNVVNSGTEQVNENNQITVDIAENFKGQIVARATDNVEHTGLYVNPDGVIFEQANPTLEFDKLVDVAGNGSTTTDVYGVNELFASDVVVGFTANDSDVLDSGIRTVEWSVEAPYDEANNKTGYVTINNLGKIEAIGGEAYKDYELLNVTDHNLVHTVTGAILVKNDSNDIKVTITVTDRSGNSVTETKILSIDKTAPVIDIKFEDEDKKTGAKSNQYNKARVAVITVKERNFDAKRVVSSVENLDPDYNSVPSLKKLTKISKWTPKTVGYDKENPDETTYTIKVKFPLADGKFKLVAKLTDMVDNASNVAAPKVFIIDSIAPTFSISYSSDVEAQNGNYFSDTRVAIITIVEHNFDPHLLTNLITAKNNGDNPNAKFVQPNVVWSKDKDKDVHVATVTFKDNFEYSVLFELFDESGNTCTITEDKFTVDKNAPELDIKGIKTASNAAYNDDDILPVLTITDADGNIDPSKVIVKLSGTKANNREEKAYTSFGDNVKETKNGYVFTLKDFMEKVIDTDDIYYLVIEAADLAGNPFSYNCHFSVNRFGSTYKSDFTFEKDTDIAYTTSVMNRKLFSEVNCDFLNPEATVLTLTYTNENQIESTTKTLERDVDYKVTEPSKKADEFNIKTYEYELINTTLFELDGMYEIFSTTVDNAGNTNQNNKTVNKEKLTKKILSFVVDKNAPVLDYSISLENTKIDSKNADDNKIVLTKGKIRDENFSTDGKSATLTLGLSEKNLTVDAIDMDSLKISYNGKEVKTEPAVDGKSVTFTLNADEGIATGHELLVSLKDKAGNESVLSFAKLLVSNNWFVRYYNNKPAFYGTIAGALAVVGGGMSAIIIRKRKIDQDED